MGKYNWLKLKLIPQTKFMHRKSKKIDLKARDIFFFAAAKEYVFEVEISPARDTTVKRLCNYLTWSIPEV